MTEEKKNPTDDQDSLVAVPEHDDMSILAIPEVDLELAIKRAEQNVAIYNRIKEVSLKVTKPQDWVLQDGKTPYLMERGAQNVANMWGVDITMETPVLHWVDADEKGKYYMYTVKGRAYAKQLGRVIEDEGVCTSRDKLFGRTKEGFRELDEVDMPNVRRKAVTNLYNRLIKRVTGLINVTLEDLQRAGFNTNDMFKVSFRSGAGRASARLSDDEKATRQKIWKMLLELEGGDEELAATTLKTVTTFKTDQGERFAATIEDLTTGPWIRSTYGKVKKMHQDKLGYTDREGQQQELAPENGR